EDMVGRSDLLATAQAVNHYKTLGLDFSKIFHQVKVPATVGRFCSQVQDHGLAKSLDVTTLLDLCRPAIDESQRVEKELPIRNTDRVVGTITGSAITRKHGAQGLPADTIRLYFRGSAGQSFGAFIPRGMTLILE